MNRGFAFFSSCERMNFLKNLTGSSGAGAASGGGAGGGLDIGSMAKQGMRALGLDPQGEE